MIETPGLTKVVSDRKNLFQCYHNTVGFCKFRDQCRYKHYIKICTKNVCKDRECKFRHPKTCKFGEACAFLKRKRCFYNHKNSRVDLNIDSADKLLKEVQELKAEILTLRKTIQIKELKLGKLAQKDIDQDKSIKELENENKQLVNDANKYKKLIDDMKRDNNNLKVKKYLINR